MSKTPQFETVGGRPGRPGGRGLIEDSLVIAGAAGLSRLTGLVRVIAAASVLGSTLLGDLFVAINFLPLSLYSAFAGSAISSVLVPPLVRYLDRGDEDGARRLTASALGFAVSALAVLAVVAIVGRRWIGSALTAGIDDPLAADAASTADILLLLILPQLVLYAAIGVFISIQHARRRFLVPSVGPVIENLGLIATVVATWFLYGGGLEVDRAPRGLLLLLAIGSGLSVLVHALVQFAGAWRASGGFGISARWADPAVRALAPSLGHSLGWTGVITARHFALIVAAGFAGAGAVQALEIAILVYFVPTSLIGRPIASAALPRLSRASADNRAQLGGYLAALRLAAGIAVPAGLAMALLAGPLAEAIAQGQFDRPGAQRMVAYALAGLGLGACGEALFEVARQATMAQGDGASLRRSNLVRAATAIVGIPAVIVLLDGPVLLLGLGLVVSVGDATAFIAAHLTLRCNRAWPADVELWWPRIVAAAAIAVLPVAVAARFVSHGSEGLRLLVVVVAAAVLYLWAVSLLTDGGRMIRSLHGSLRGEGLA